MICVEDFCNIVLKYISMSDIRVVFDIGSKDGKDAVIMHNRLEPKKTFVIEAYDKEYKLYSDVKNNEIVWINQLIYNYNGESKFYPKEIGSGIHSIRNRGDEYGKKCLTLPCKRMDTLCIELGIEYIDVAKIDVEGCTYECLESFGNMLQNIKVMHIETESIQFFEGQYLHSDVCKLLLKQFKIVKISESIISKILNGFQYDSIWINRKINK